MLFLLLLTYMSSYIDRSILGILAEPMKTELRLSDGEIGVLSGLTFALFYTLMGIPIARLAERYSRSAIIAVSLVVWSGMTALCGFAASYAQLLLCRIGVGVGEAGGNPSSHSLITDIFPPERRASALAIYSLGVPLGSLIGAVAGGALAQSWGWRTAFLVVGPPGILLAALVMLTIREPARGQSEARHTSEEVPPFGAVVRLLFGNSVFRNIAAGAALIVLAGYSVALFTAPFFLRQYGLPIRDVGLISGAINGIGAGAGIILGGFMTDAIGPRDRRYYAWLPAICLAAAGPLFALAFLQQSWVATTLLMLLATLLIYTYLGPIFAILYSMVEPRMRATAAAIMYLIVNLVGMGLGPPIVGVASDVFAARAFNGRFAQSCPAGMAPEGASDMLRQACHAASATGMRYALVLCGVIFLWAAAHFALAGRRMGRDQR